ncbi:MAG TPA: hypothetical protein VIG42_04650 [Solirubrobacteraceae bacterium]|jgi:hypothetical protein
MSVSTEVQRTLVKSPPELWAELSDPEALTRHLGDFGEITITSVEPETKVEWESEGARGAVHLKQSGWGTKVTLSVTRNPPASDEPSEPEPPLAEPVAQEPELLAEPEPVVQEPELLAEPEPVVQEPELLAEPEPEEQPDTLAVVESEIEDEPNTRLEPNPEPRLGLFARLFRKRKAKKTEAVEPVDVPIAIGEPAVEQPDAASEVVALAAPEPIYPEPPPSPPAADLASELACVEAQMAEETTELLTGVLDRLGAAHHRPFSRG